jgi:hypothetical protein
MRTPTQIVNEVLRRVAELEAENRRSAPEVITRRAPRKRAKRTQRKLRLEDARNDGTQDFVGTADPRG